MSGTVRLLPLVACAALGLALLKSAGLIASGGYVLSGVAPASAQADKAQAATAPPPAAAATAEPAPDEPAAAGGGMGVLPQSEREVLESLAERRKALDRRDRELELRENLLRAAEAQVEQRIETLKALETQIQSELRQQDEERAAQIARLVNMYTEMKPKDAARILNRLDVDVLSEIAARMKPRDMSAILARMDPTVAQRLTQEIATQNAAPAETAEPSLPKIEGRGPS